MIALRAEPFDPWETIRAYQAEHLSDNTGYGATASFVGTMRDFNDGESVSEMILEHYPGMTERELERIVEQAVRRWALIDALIVHRVGPIRPAEPIVLVAVWSAHRGAAFDACRSMMEALKRSAPFWKKERIGDGAQRWVETNTDGYGPN